MGPLASDHQAHNLDSGVVLALWEVVASHDARRERFTQERKRMPTGGEAEHPVLRQQSLGGGEITEAQVLIGVIERELELVTHPRRVGAAVFGREPKAHLPEELASSQPELIAPTDPDQILDRGAGELGRGTTHQVAKAAIRTVLLSLDHHLFRHFLAPIPDESETDPHPCPLSLPGEGDAFR